MNEQENQSKTLQAINKMRFNNLKNIDFKNQTGNNNRKDDDEDENGDGYSDNFNNGNNRYIF